MITHRNSAMNRAATMPLAALVLLGALTCIVESAPLITTENSIRVCSSSLSDLLYLVCLGRGYNEPRDGTGAGELVEMCCMKRCTYKYLLQYCKPAKTDEEKKKESQAVYNDVRIVSRPPERRDMSSEENSKLDMDYVSGAIKRKVDDLKKGRHRGKVGRNDDHECKGNADTKKRHQGRHCRCRRRRLQCRRASKIEISLGSVKTLDNKFTTSSSSTAKPIKKRSIKNNTIDQ